VPGLVYIASEESGCSAGPEEAVFLNKPLTFYLKIFPVLTDV